MFKVGSKLFLGLTGFAAVNLVAYLVFVERLAIGGVALSIVFAALVGLTAAVLIVNEGDDEAQPRDNALTRASMWPLVTVLGLVLFVLGLVVAQVYFVLAIVVVLAALAEWMVQAWSESASDDPAHNESARRRVLHPIEFPVIAMLGLGVIIFFFSRIMLAISKSAGAVAFIVAAAVILLVGSAVAPQALLPVAFIPGGSVARPASCVISALLSHVDRPCTAVTPPRPQQMRYASNAPRFVQRLQCRSKRTTPSGDSVRRFDFPGIHPRIPEPASPHAITPCRPATSPPPRPHSRSTRSHFATRAASNSTSHASISRRARRCFSSAARDAARAPSSS